MGTIGVLLINLGSPDADTTPAVRRYLREFLMDARVIDIPYPARLLLINGIIAPFRSPKSAHAYQKIWTAKGSPLVSSGLELQDKVQKLLGPDYLVRTAMRYGSPNIPSQVKLLLEANVEEIRVLPLYPQYATASVASSVEAVMQALLREYAFPPLRVLPDFYEDSGFINAFADVTQRHLKSFPADHILFSYHGLPQSQLQKTTRKFETCRF